MKSIIWKIELAAAVLLAVSALVWGLRPGVWNYGGFYRMAAGEQGRTYTRPGCSTVEVTEDNRLRIRSPAGQTAEFTLSLAENGSYRAAEMAMDGVVRNVTYNTATGTFMTAGDSWSISTLVQEKAGFSPGLTDNALYSMALGNHQTRIAGRPGEFLTAGLFLLLSLFVLCCHAQALPAALRAIVTGAFSPRTAVSGIGGFGTAQAIQWGLRRGAFSNEAGLGSSAIAHGSAAARSPGEQGLWGIFEVFADTIVICTATALTILCSGVGIPWGSSPGAELLLSAWETCIPAAPAACFMALSLLLFAFTSVLGWALYGTQCVRFLWGEKAAAPYRLCFSLAITVGCLVSLRTVWAAADLLNGLMAIPNFIALFALSGKAAKYAEM